MGPHSRSPFSSNTHPLPHTARLTLSSTCVVVGPDDEVVLPDM